MVEDSFIDEVSQELKQEKILALWRKYGRYVLITASLLLLSVIIYQIYSYAVERKTEKLGDSMLSALTLADSAKPEDALPALNKLAQNSSSYGYLARFTKAGILQSQKKSGDAIKIYDAIMQDKRAPSLLKDVARIRKAYALVDSKDMASITAELGPFLKDGNHFQSMAYEVLGLTSLKLKDLDKAKAYFQLIVSNDLAPRSLSIRAAMMLWCIDVEKKRNEA